MKYLRTVKGCTKIDQLRNELGILPLYEKLTEYKNNWKIHLQRMKQSRIPLQAYKYCPSGRRDLGRPRRRWKET
jgi:hypothetical protein